MSGGNIKVVVRCRPLNTRELARGAKGLVRMEGNQTILDPSEVGSTSSKATEKKAMHFSFDKSYWSAGHRDEPDYASQRTLYTDLGVELLDHSFEGFNTCIFAYGQTGSGKSYSMMGYGADKGIIPLTTSELFRRVEDRSSTESKSSYTVEVSYIEIYNEKVRDLLNPKNKGNLKVREHPSLGPYVEDLSRLVVENDQQMMTLMDEGNKARTVASTNMNETSSRSHAVFTVILTQKRHDGATDMTGEKVSKISLVDLAGSERQTSTGATGARLKEGANINRSLTTLGKVIAALAQASDPGKAGKKKKEDFVPYRDSVLTWLLKESLGGNSKTAMIAAISPADYEETLSTLRYADAAKKIKTHAVVNEDPNAKLIRELKEELDMLRSRVASGGNAEESLYDPAIPPERQIVTYRTKDGEIRKVSKLELQDQLEASEKLMESLNLTWEEKMVKTQTIHLEREKALEELGISIDKNVIGVHAPQRIPSLVNLNEDPLMSECLVYQLKPGTTIAGSSDDDKAHIKLSGSHILAEHCIFTNADGVVSVEAMLDARTFVNGKRVPSESPVKLLNGFRVILGDFHVFRFNDPASVRAHREKLGPSASIGDLPGAIGSNPGIRPVSPGRGEVEEMMDWSAARREVANIEKMGDQDLDKLFDDIVKVRTQRKRPDSRLDLAAELESRFMSTSHTEESLENPWAAAHGTTLTSNSIGTPIMGDMDKIDQVVIEQRSEADTELHAMPQMYNHKAEDVALEQKHMAKQLRTMAQELKRTRSEAAVAKVLERPEMEPANWAARELRLLQWGLERWKRLRVFKMAEEILKGAASIREANVIAWEMGKGVSYNFLVVDGSVRSPTSSLNDNNGVVEFDDVAISTTDVSGPSVVVKVLDQEAQAVYTWESPKFIQQFSKMRHVVALRERPNYLPHFKVDGTFTDTPSPSFSYIGSAKAPLRLLGIRVSHVMTIPILCPYTMEAIGSCRIGIDCGSSTSGVATPDWSSMPLQGCLHVGSKFNFTLTVDSVKGLSSVDLDMIRAQTRLSSLVGPWIESEDIYSSLPIDLSKTSGAHLSLRRSISVIVTTEMIEYLRSGWLPVDFVAKVRPEYLARLERFDRHREASVLTSLPGTPSRTEGKPAMRRCETEAAGPEQHDILASVSISEMTADGTYLPSEVMDEMFNLHQGLQRRMKICLSHSAGKSLALSKLDHVSTSDVRLLAKGKAASVGQKQVEVKMKSQVEELADGTSRLEGDGVWDSGAHGCSHLDRRTGSDQKVLIRLTWLVDVENLDEPAVFQLDLPLRIVSRDAKRSSFLTFFTAAKIYTSLTAIFTLSLAPPLVRSAADLWRLDTAKQYVKGEEGLGGWKVRSLSLLEDFERLRSREKGLGEVQVTKAVLDLLGDIPPVDIGQDAEKRQALVQRCINLWKREMELRVPVDVRERSEEEEAVARKLERLLPDLKPKLVPIVKLQPRVESVIKCGLLMLLRDSQANVWEKLHFVLRRPYLLVHPTANEREIMVINLSKGHVVNSPDVEKLLGHKDTFTIFTTTNSYILQAPSAKELREWIRVLITSTEV